MAIISTSNDTVHAVRSLLRGFSIEVTPGDVKSLDAASHLLPAGTEVFIASLPKGTPDQLVTAATQLRRSGVIPVPHIAARAYANLSGLDSALAQLSDRAGVDRVLLIAGDRENPAGAYESSLQVLQAGVLEKYGIKTLYVACYPEGHPRIADDVLEQQRIAKLEEASKRGLRIELVSQFCFEAAPIISFARHMRSSGAIVPSYRVGLAGPANSATLLKYAMMCGVGASIRALRERQSLAKTLLSGPTPEDLIETLALARHAEPNLGIDGLHFFTFGSLAMTATMIADIQNRIR